jgi:hypothetical protein
MTRLCDRPGCSERGAIAYGFDADRLLVWLMPYDPDADRNRAGTLCVRHADSMVVPLGWTLEDARDPMPRLFRPATRARPARPARRPKKQPAETPTRAVEQLRLGDPATPPPVEAAAGDVAAHTVVEVTGVSSSPDDPDATVAMPWMPDFDITDELGGALSATTPLLARAFRGVDRHDA